MTPPHHLIIMDIHIIGTKREKAEVLEELAGKSLADEITFVTERDKDPAELLSELIYEDFVKAR